ncbi:MAG: lysophospholipase [Candidatus Limnocylindrales bacterium]|jgi:acylglycerol lipase
MAARTDPAGGPAADVGVASRPSEGTAPDGTALHLRHWPASGQAWATVLIVHGIGEHSGRYERTGRLMAEAGLDVHAFDLRGHGLSGGRRVYVRHWDDFLDDVEAQLATLRRPGLRLVLFGHSMGALIALNYACSDRPKPDLLVLSAPPLQAAVPRWQRVLAPILSRVAPTTVVANPISGDQLASDSAVGVAYFADPLVQPRSTMRLGAEFFSAMKRGRGGLGRLRVPTLVIHGGADTLVPTAGSEPLAAVPGVERRVLPNLRHETLNEPQGPEVVAGIVEWLRAHV